MLSEHEARLARLVRDRILNKPRYFGSWDCYEAFAQGWDGVTEPATDEEIIFASYHVDGYEGGAFVLFWRDGQLYEVNSSHCSCNGLEWDPEPTTWAALAARRFHVDDGQAELEELVHGHAT